MLNPDHPPRGRRIDNKMARRRKCSRPDLSKLSHKLLIRSTILLLYLHLLRHSSGASGAGITKCIDHVSDGSTQAQRSCASSLVTFTQSFLHRAWPKTRGLESGSRSALIVVAHVFSWPLASPPHVRGGVGRYSSLICCNLNPRQAHLLFQCFRFTSGPVPTATAPLSSRHSSPRMCPR